MPICGIVHNCVVQCALFQASLAPPLCALLLTLALYTVDCIVLCSVVVVVSVVVVIVVVVVVVVTGQSHTGTLWAATNTGVVYIYQLTVL